MQTDARLQAKYGRDETQRLHHLAKKKSTPALATRLKEREGKRARERASERASKQVCAQPGHSAVQDRHISRQYGHTEVRLKPSAHSQTLLEDDAAAASLSTMSSTSLLAWTNDSISVPQEPCQDFPRPSSAAHGEIDDDAHFVSSRLTRSAKFGTPTESACTATASFMLRTKESTVFTTDEVIAA